MHNIDSSWSVDFDFLSILFCRDIPNLVLFEVDSSFSVYYKYPLSGSFTKIKRENKVRALASQNFYYFAIWSDLKYHMKKQFYILTFCLQKHVEVSKL